MAKKRANGEGSIRKRKDGRWEGRYTEGRNPDTGKPIYKNVLGKTQAEVREKLKAALDAVGKPDATRTGQYSLGQWMDIWFEDYAKVHVRPSSHQTYRGYIQNHISPNIGALPLEKVTRVLLPQFFSQPFLCCGVPPGFSCWCPWRTIHSRIF